MTQQSVVKYLVSVVIYGEKDSVNKLVKTLNQNLRPELNSTLIKLILNKDDSDLRILTQNRCKKNQDGLFVGSILCETAIKTQYPNKIFEKIINDRILVNNFLQRLNFKPIYLYIAVKSLKFQSSDFRNVNDSLLPSRKAIEI